MKKILGILLSLCFVMSVTAATAAAGDGSRDNHLEKYNKFGHGNDKKFGHYKSFFKYNAPCGYWKKVVIVKKIGFGHHKKVIKTIKWVWVSTRNHYGHGSWCQFKFPHGFR
ncbi:MAG: hypothetical protein ACM3RX_01585 [Methanococcaceae archaeon]